ncbi:MOSC domain-containing protein [Nocardiopsis dassonvillei]|uniref:MOSC domain-containing protein n=1 Tax=Nocardiopsis dassonvillei TaxID=2014 RepID=UPI000B9D6A67|nr:MOSC N-terminal beta barrel domain-containing protein [Nocardiopsis dassonvillei]ASU60519.1 MOSC domain-containing protein [Nocardiopsis dassonvillei]
MARIEELVHYPVKGCAGTSVRTAEMTSAGIRHDRTFMVVDDAGGFRSQRNDPRMALIRAGITADGARLSLGWAGTDGSAPLEVGVDPGGPRLDVTMHRQPFVGVDQGREAAEWLSEALGAPSRLVRVPDDHDRHVGGLTPGTSAFADSTAVLMASLASLDLLGERILARGAEPVPMNRFRPNVVVSGWAEPHTEDRVRALRLGTAELGFAKVCVRCVATTVDQARGVKAGPEPLRTLADYRRAQGGVAFGAKFAVTRTGTLAVGDEVEVLAWEQARDGDPDLAGASA